MTLSRVLAAKAALIFAFALTMSSARSAAQTVTQLRSAGTTQPISVPANVTGIQNPEVDEALSGGDDDDDLGIDLNGNVSGKTSINRTIAPGPGQGANVNGKAQAKSNPEI